MKEGSSVEHLFDAELQHTGDVDISPMGPKDGELAGGGEGKALGPVVTGKLRWSLYEKTTPLGCSMQLPGEITTDDGALIQFEARGQAMVPNDKAPAHWRVGGAFRFRPRTSATCGSTLCWRFGWAISKWIRDEHYIDFTFQVHAS